MNRSVIALGVLGFVVLTAIWWFIFLNPTSQSVAARQQELQLAEEREQLLRGRIAELNDINDEEFSYRMAIEQVEASLPEDAMLDRLIEDLNALAEETGVDVVSIAATPPVFNSLEPEQDLFEIELTLSLEGQYFEILGFVVGLEDMERLVRIDTVSMAPAQVPEATTTTTTSTTTTTTTPTVSSTTTSTSTTTTTTTTTLPPQSIEADLLTVTIQAVAFTRTPLEGIPASTTVPGGTTTTSTPTETTP